jgi:serine/threonine protein kinase
MKKTMKKTHKKRSRTIKLKGGKVFGRGTFGVVLGEPRVPCENEDYINDRIGSKQEVSKLFFNEKNLESVVVTRELLHKAFTPDELKNLNNYFLLPEKFCKINKKEMRKHRGVYSSVWREGTEISKHTVQITSDQGTRDLYAELANISTKAELITFLKKMRRIIEGIEKLHNKNIVHGDLKLQNAMVDLQGNFKIIDVDELRNIDTFTFEPAYFYENHSYAIWPTLVNIFIINYYDIKFSSNDEFIQATQATLFNTQSTEKFHSDYDDTLSKITRHNFSKTLLKEKDPANYDKISGKILKIVSKKYGKNGADQLRGIYKYIDRYSFGIMLLSSLKKYFEIVGAKNDDPIIADLLEIIENCCFIKNGLNTTTEHIMREYISFTETI